MSVPTRYEGVLKAAHHRRRINVLLQCAVNKTELHRPWSVATTIMKKSLEQRIADVVQEHVSIVSYDPNWPIMFVDESEHLRNTFPSSIIKRIEHFGSTAIPGLPAKPIIDVLVEVSSHDEVEQKVVPILEEDGYGYFYRPILDGPPEYDWFIKRDDQGSRSHHIHMVEAESPLWERLYFVEYLKEFPEEAKNYAQLKLELATKFPNDRIAYTKSKTDFIVPLTRKAVEYCAHKHRLG